MNFISFLKENRRWLGGGFLLAFFSSFGQTYFIALFGGEIRQEFMLSHGEFGGLYMAATLASAATLPFLGRIVDFVSVSRTCLLAFSGLAFFAAITASASSIAMLFVALYGLRLFGQGMMTHISMTAMGRWYVARRGRAVAIASTGLQTGEAILPILFVTLTAMIGWRSSWWIGVSLLLLALPIVYALLAKERVPQGTTLGSDGSSTHSWTRAEVLRDHYFWLIMIAALAPPFIGTTIFFHQIHIIEIKDWSRDVFASSFFVMSISTVIFSLVFGTLIDRFSAVRLLPAFLIPMGIASILMAQMEDQAVIFGFMALFGISYGGSSALIGTLWPEIYGTKHLGSVRSVVVALMVLASAVGPGLTGMLIDLGVSLETQLHVMALYCFAAAMSMVAVSRGLILRHQQAVSAV